MVPLVDGQIHPGVTYLHRSHRLFHSKVWSVQHLPHPQAAGALCQHLSNVYPFLFASHGTGILLAAQSAKLVTNVYSTHEAALQHWRELRGRVS